MIRQGSRVVIEPNARLYRGETSREGDGYLPIYTDERGTVIDVAACWLKLKLDYVAYPDGEPLEEAWVRKTEVVVLDAIDTLAELAHPRLHMPDTGNDHVNPYGEMPW